MPYSPATEENRESSSRKSLVVLGTGMAIHRPRTAGDFNIVSLSLPLPLPLSISVSLCLCMSLFRSVCLSLYLTHTHTHITLTKMLFIFIYFIFYLQYDRILFVIEYHWFIQFEYELFRFLTGTQVCLQYGRILRPSFECCLYWCNH